MFMLVATMTTWDLLAASNSTIHALSELTNVLYLLAPCDKFEPLFLSESSLSGQNMSLRGWPLVANLSNVRPVSVQVLKKQKMPV